MSGWYGIRWHEQGSIKEGRGSHADSLGNVAVVRPGGIQWMRTGSGVEHAEGGGTPGAASGTASGTASTSSSETALGKT